MLKRMGSIQMKIGACFGVLLVLFVAVSIIWGFFLMRDQGVREAEARAVSLADEMTAVWDYVESHQPYSRLQEEYDEDIGGLACVLAVKAIAEDFNSGSDTMIRYVSLRPRNTNDSPDRFEEEALRAFQSDATLETYGGLDDDSPEGGRYRYLKPLRMEEDCEMCHGGIAGERDILGYAKEGYSDGDLVGALSVVVPVGAYDGAVAQTNMSGIALFAVGLVVALVAMTMVVHLVVVRPVRRLSTAMDAFRKGDLSHRILKSQGTDELSALARDFNRMADELEGLYADLEERVALRTEDLKRKSEELERFNAQLETKQSELASALERLKEEQEIKNRFFAYMSHELRTPLTSILAYAEMFARDEGRPGESCDSESGAAFARIATNAKSLVRVVNNILLFSKGEAGMLQLHEETIDLVDLVEVACSSFGPMLRERGIRLETIFASDLPLVQSDKEMIRSVLTNYLGNAVRFTSEKGDITVSVLWDDSTGIMSIRVEDSGCGVDFERVDELFKPYQQSASSFVAGGTGLGLAVVNKFAEICGGRAYAEKPKKGFGSVFVFEFSPRVVDEEDVE